VVYPGNMSIFFTYSASTAFFTMGDQIIQLSPIPSQILTPNPTQLPETSPTPNNSPTPSIVPSSTSIQTLASNYWLNPTSLTAIASVIALVAVALVSLVYFRRRGKQ
jgi:hypothetical protein